MCLWTVCGRSVGRHLWLGQGEVSPSHGVLTQPLELPLEGASEPRLQTGVPMVVTLRGPGEVALRQMQGVFGEPWLPSVEGQRDMGDRTWRGAAPPAYLAPPVLFQEAARPTRTRWGQARPRIPPPPPGSTGSPSPGPLGPPLTGPVRPQVPLLMTPPPPPFPPPPLLAARRSPEDGRRGSGLGSPTCEYPCPGGRAWGTAGLPPRPFEGTVEGG